MIHHFLINPAAGRGDRTDAMIRRITGACSARKLDFRIYTTARPGDATDYVRRTVTEFPDTPHRFYACGGDGTLCETVNGAPTAANAEFTVIPIGTGNDFVRNFTNSENFLDIERHIDGEAVKIDLLLCNGRSCINMINIGFDCNAAKRTGEIKRSPLVPSGCAYAFGVVITLCGHMGTPMHIELGNGEVIREELLLSTVANGGFCGGGFHSNPRASLTDGLFDICAVRKISRAKFIGMIKYYKAGTHLETEKIAPYLRYYQTDTARFRFEKPINICVDGEIEMSDTVDIRILPAALSFSVPKGSAPVSAEMPTAATETV